MKGLANGNGFRPRAAMVTLKMFKTQYRKNETNIYQRSSCGSIRLYGDISRLSDGFMNELNVSGAWRYNAR